MTDYEIEDGHEMPTPGQSGAPIKYPFGEMEVGQSFFVAPDNRAAVRKNSTSSRVAAAASYYGKRHGKKFTCQKQPCGGYRVWRVS